MPPIKVLIAYPSTLIAESLCLLLRAADPAIEIVALVADSARLPAAVDTYHPDMALVSSGLTGESRAEGTESIRSRCPATAVLVLAGAGEDEAIRAHIRAGASGFVCTGNATGDELVQAIRAVHAGRSWLPRILTPAAMAPCSCLNKKEVEILNLVCCQKSSKQIADKVGLTRRSVEVYRKKINEKIGVVNAVGAALYAVKQGIFKV